MCASEVDIWGDELEIRAASDLYKWKICLHYCGTRTKENGDNEESSENSDNNGSSKKCVIWQARDYGEYDDQNCMHLLYHDKHYKCLYKWIDMQ